MIDRSEGRDDGQMLGLYQGEGAFSGACVVSLQSVFFQAGLLYLGHVDQTGRAQADPVEAPGLGVACGEGGERLHSSSLKRFEANLKHQLVLSRAQHPSILGVSVRSADAGSI